ncbi:uncharacterized protein [Drosophila kikkawai]|uniref:Uncharacterized protein isoform X1 n=1 Tax=Drosophila kikkawai TaxID=30033 RepID=A0ABM4G9R9_DROKI
MAPSISNKFTLICDRLSHFESRVCNPAAPTPSKYSCQIHLDQVRALWDKVETEYEACSELISVGLEGAADTLPTLKAKYDDTYSIYERCAAKFMEQIDTISAKAAPVQPPAPQNSFPSGYRLPPCETEVFSGDYLRWPTFRDLFTAVYIDNPTLTPVEKLFYLNAKTSGEAHSIVSNSPLTNDGFRSAWENLSERFENKRALVNSQLKKLLNIQSIERESSAALKELQNTIQNCLTSLTLSGLPTDNWDCLLVYLCSSKLPKLTLSLWEQSLPNKTEIPTWLELDSFLTERHRTLETIDSLQPPTLRLSPSKPTKSIVAPRVLKSFSTRIVPISKRCDLCSAENHPVRLCPRFLQMTIVDRPSYIEKKQLCSNCFASGHPLRNCTSAHSCLICHGRHHTLLHPSNTSSSVPNPRDDAPQIPAPIQRVSSFSTRVTTSADSNYWVPYDDSKCRRSRGILSYQCRVCQGNHPLRKCHRFLRLDAKKRLQTVIDRKYCVNCLAHHHSGGSCRSSDRCQSCGQDHHTLLHADERSALSYAFQS